MLVGVIENILNLLLMSKVVTVAGYYGGWRAPEHIMAVIAFPAQRAASALPKSRVSSRQILAITDLGNIKQHRRHLP